jgi:hypothetical protein
MDGALQIVAATVRIPSTATNAMVTALKASSMNSATLFRGAVLMRKLVMALFLFE